MLVVGKKSSAAHFTPDMFYNIIKRLLDQFTPAELCLSLNDGDKYFWFINKRDLFYADLYKNLYLSDRLEKYGVPHFLLNKFIQIQNNQFPLVSAMYSIGFNTKSNGIKYENPLNDIQIIQNDNEEFTYYLIHYVHKLKTVTVYGTATIDSQSCIPDIICKRYGITEKDIKYLSTQNRTKPINKLDGLIVCVWASDLLISNDEHPKPRSCEALNRVDLCNWLNNVLTNRLIISF